MLEVISLSLLSPCRPPFPNRPQSRHSALELITLQVGFHLAWKGLKGKRYSQDLITNFSDLCPVVCLSGQVGLFEVITPGVRGLCAENRWEGDSVCSSWENLFQIG